LLQDLRQALRLFRRNPGFAATVVLTLALAIGLTSAMFSVVDGVLLRPLPYDRPSELVAARGVSPLALTEWRSRTTTLAGIASYDSSHAPLVFAGREAARLRQVLVSANFLDVLGVRPALGRGLLLSDGVAGAEPVVILTDGVWRLQFGARPGVIGELAPFEPRPLRIVGVLPAAVVLPMRVGPFGEPRILTVLPDSQRTAPTSGVVARLRRGSTLASARAEESSIVRLSDKDQSPTMAPLTSTMLGRYGPSLWRLFAAVGSLLLIACANVGNLMFAKVLETRRDLAIRRALGAGTGEVDPVVALRAE
jgi:putative ABC transport system permease protein